MVETFYIQGAVKSRMRLGYVVLVHGCQIGGISFITLAKLRMEQHINIWDKKCEYKDVERNCY